MARVSLISSDLTENKHENTNIVFTSVSSIYKKKDESQDEILTFFSNHRFGINILENNRVRDAVSVQFADFNGEGRNEAKVLGRPD